MASHPRNPVGFTDDELLAGLRDPGRLDDAIGFLYRSHYRLIEHFVLTNQGSRADAEDLFQDTLVAFLESVQGGRFRGESSVKTFLYTLARHRWISELRRRGSEIRRQDWYETQRDRTEADAAALLAQHEARNLLAALFDRLGESCRQILHWFYYENQSMKEILQKTTYENEQVVRNKKYKCLRELTDLVRHSPDLTDRVRTALNQSETDG
jgi:RNA polymerase sigma factor (sigma-70 family)